MKKIGLCKDKYGTAADLFEEEGKWYRRNPKSPIIPKSLKETIESLSDKYSPKMTKYEKRIIGPFADYKKYPFALFKDFKGIYYVTIDNTPATAGLIYLTWLERKALDDIGITSGSFSSEYGFGGSLKVKISHFYRKKKGLIDEGNAMVPLAKTIQDLENYWKHLLEASKSRSNPPSSESSEETSDEKGDKFYRENPRSPTLAAYEKELGEYRSKIKCIPTLKGWRIEEFDYMGLPCLIAGAETRNNVTISFGVRLKGIQVIVSGHYLYENNIGAVSIDKAIEYVKKIMKYVNYGRYELGITSDAFKGD